MSDVFVSYKAEDRRRVKPLVEALESEGYSVWWDEQIGGGATWRHMIEAELNSAKCVIVAWSKRSVGEEGTFVQDEATRAQQRHVYVPVLIDKVHLPLGFGETQALPLTGWKGDRGDPHFQAVLAAVRRITGASKARKSARTPVGTHSKVDRRAVLAGGAVATVAVVGIGGWTLLKPGSAGASTGSIAVLPFANLSGDPAQAYFSDGIAEEIRSSLARLAGLKVVGRTSSEAVRNDDAQTAAKKLEVANILTGSVRQSPSTIRITAELIDGRTGLDRWSEDYDRSPGDSIKIQSDIAQNVATALSTALGGAAKAAASVGGTTNAEAQRLYLQAKAMTDGQPSKERFEHAFQLFDSAIALDPNYADAIALRAIALIAYGNNYAKGADGLAQNRAEALRFAQTALRIAPKLAGAHGALFFLHSSNLEIAPAYSEIKLAVQLSPGDADALSSLASFTGSVLGDTGSALKLSDRAISADRLNPNAYDGRLSLLFYARRYDEAASYGRKLEQDWPTQINRPLMIGDSLVLLGRPKDAQPYFDQAPQDYWWRMTSQAILAARLGDRAGAQSWLAKLQKAYGDAASTQFGEIYAQLGDKDRAFASLNRAYEIKDAGLSKMQTDPWLDPMRSDPRFAELRRKMNFPA